MRLDLNWMKFRTFGPKPDVWSPLAFFVFGVFCLSSLFPYVVVAIPGYLWVVSGYLVVPRSFFFVFASLFCLLWGCVSHGLSAFSSPFFVFFPPCAVLFFKDQFCHPLVKCQCLTKLILKK